MKITVLAGGVGGAAFVRGLRALGGLDITVVANVGDDMWLSGLRVCPDLDSLMYTLAGVSDETRGWGRADESDRVAGELHAYGVGWPWFTLQDLDIGTHVARTGLLRDGLPLSEVTRRLTARWDLGLTLVPASDDTVETWVETDTPDLGTIHFEEWWVRHRAGVPVRRFVQQEASTARPAPGVVDAITSADVVLFAPSNPVVSVGTMVGFPAVPHDGGSVPGITGIADALRAAPAPVVGISPVIGGAPVRGMARECLQALGVRCTAEAIGRAYGARSDTPAGLLDGWLVDEEDMPPPRYPGSGLRLASAPTRMVNVNAAARVAVAALDLAAAVSSTA